MSEEKSCHIVIRFCIKKKDPPVCREGRLWYLSICHFIPSSC